MYVPCDICVSHMFYGLWAGVCRGGLEDGTLRVRCRGTTRANTSRQRQSGNLSQPDQVELEVIIVGQNVGGYGSRILIGIRKCIILFGRVPWTLHS
jgi:hypothetical protein